MSDANTDMLGRVETTAERLRRVQIDFADEPDEVRREYMEEELRRALVRVEAGGRAEFLRQVQQQFPDGPGLSEAIDAAQDGAVMMHRLMEVLPTLPVDQQQVIVQQIGQWLGTAQGFEWPEELAQALRGKLSLRADEPLDVGRALELTGLLVEFSASLYQLGWQMWKTIAPESAVKRTGSLPVMMGRWLSGKEDATREQVAGELAKLRQLIASLVSAISQAGRQFASAYASRFAPAEIESAAASEKGGLFSGKESRCWRKYLELAEALDEQAIDGEIRQAVASYAEQLMKGLGH